MCVPLLRSASMVVIEGVKVIVLVVPSKRCELHPQVQPEGHHKKREKKRNNKQAGKQTSKPKQVAYLVHAQTRLSFHQARRVGGVIRSSQSHKWSAFSRRQGVGAGVEGGCKERTRIDGRRACFLMKKIQYTPTLVWIQGL